MMDYSKISNVSVTNIDHRDYPDFVDAYIDYAEYGGEPMTQEQLDELNEDREFVWQEVMDKIF